MKTYEITEEQIKEIETWGNSKDSQKVREEWFPEVFETKFTNGWYKYKNGNWKKWLVYADFENNKSYGAVTDGSWSTTVDLDYIKKHCESATDSEVLESLKNEFKKQNPNVQVERYVYNEIQNIMGVVLECGTSKQCFNNGTWNKFYTKEEAEKLLKAKIV